MVSGLLACLLLIAADPAGGPVVFRGMCDASAAVAIDARTFVAADDEGNTLRVFRRDQPEEPFAPLPWDRHLGIDPDGKHPEADIEGAAALAEHVYWITSHGRNRNGKWRANRHRFFAMTIRADDDGRVTAEPVGRAYERLADDLQRDARLRALGLAETIRSDHDDVPRLAPKDEGVNIEGLAAGLDGRSLLIGFRNPRPGDRALIVPLLNPREVVAGRAPPRLGEPILLDLRVRRQGEILPLGIRSIEYVPAWKQYVVVAGPHDEQGVFALFRWSGEPRDRPELLRDPTLAVVRIPRFSPEAAFIWPGETMLQLLSDDGGLKVEVASPEECLPGAFEKGFCEQKALRDPQRRTFQSLALDLAP